jgi:polyvinyl alcohol dehydrogenase (cytochrome)
MRVHFVSFVLCVTRKRILHLVAALIILPVSLMGTDALQLHSHSTRAAVPLSWSTYLNNNARSGYNASETIINQDTAHDLTLQWTATSSGCAGSPGGPTTISVQPIVVQDLQMIYWGSWDGCEHATNLQGQQVWSTFIGQTSDGTITKVVIGGVTTPALLVGGGDANFYALNALTGAVIWKTPLGTAPGAFIWSSPAVYEGNVYEGLASQADCPLIQSKFFQLNAETGTIQNTFDVVPAGCTGASVWGSPTINTETGRIFFGTGNAGSCSQSESYAVSLIELNLSNLAYIGSWQVPQSQQVKDGDFGDTPTLFQATIHGKVSPLVGLMNKNGIFYAFNQGNLLQGPVWQATISTASATDVAPAAWDGATLYVAGNNATISGTTCNGSGSSLQALNPATGAFLWQICVEAYCCDYSPVTEVPGVLVVAASHVLKLVNTATGQILFQFYDSAQGAFYGGATVLDGVLYIGDSNGNLYVFAP